MQRRVIPGIFVLSGAAGLIFEVVWARQLVLVFGNTTQAVSAILTGFFGGMAIGSWLGGRVADRMRRPLRFYGFLELGLVIVVVLTPLTFRLIHEVYRSAFVSLEQTPGLLSLLRLVLSLAALAPATILMGATLPTLTRYLASNASSLGVAFTRLYVANTMGAVFGAAAAGFVLIELLGLSRTLLVGAVCSATAGGIALLMDLRPGASAAATESTAGHHATMKARSTRVALWFAFASGFTSLSYQTLWTRLIASGTGSSTYVFSTILTLFLVGLAMGSVEYKRSRARITDARIPIAISQIAIALLSITGLVVMKSLDPLAGAFFWKALAVVLPVTFLMGFSFPAASALVEGKNDEVGEASGALLAVNTLGAILATFFIPFLFIPLFGSAVMLAVTACVNVIVGVAIAATHVGGDSIARRVAVGGTTSFALALAWVVITGSIVDPNISRIQRTNGKVIRADEDEIAAVQAGELGGQLQLWVTGFSMTSLTVDARLMPILPLILRPNANTVLTIAFGMGSSYRSALIAGLKSDAVELVPSVPEMFSVFFLDADQFQKSRDGRILIGDGRSYVELTDARYDIIVVDPPPPLQSSGVSIISSLEFYKASLKRLNPGGIMMQWVPWGQTLEDFKAHVRTFRSVFPHVLVVAGPGRNGFYFLGSLNPMSIDPVNIRSVLSRTGVVEDISSAFDSPAHDNESWVAMIPGLVRLSGTEVDAFAGSGELITDDRPLPEYFLLRMMRDPSSAWFNPSEVKPPAQGSVSILPAACCHE